MDAILRLFKPVSLKLQDDDEVIAHPGGVPRPPDDARPLGVSKFETVLGCATCEPLLLRWRGCYEDLQRFEEERDNRPFQWVIRSRPDLSFGCSFPAAAQWPQPSPVQVDAPPATRQERQQLLQLQQRQQQQQSPPPLALLQQDYYIIVQRSLAQATLVLPTSGKSSSCPAPINEHDKCLDMVLRELGAKWFELNEPTLAVIQRFVSCAKMPLPSAANPFLREMTDQANSSLRIAGGQWQDDGRLVNGRTYMCHLIPDETSDGNTTRAEDASEMLRKLVDAKPEQDAEKEAEQAKECPLSALWERWASTGEKHR